MNQAVSQLCSGLCLISMGCASHWQPPTVNEQLANPGFIIDQQNLISDPGEDFRVGPFGEPDWPILDRRN